MLMRGGQLLLSPSDLSAYLACPHLTTLSLEVALGERKKPYTREALAELIAEKGELHEARHLEFLRERGREVVEIELLGESGSFEAAHDSTVSAMREGAEIVYQATFSRDGWRGRSDFLVRVDEPSELGGWSFEPHDTKLARSAKPAAVLQLAWYAGEVAAIQGRRPEHVHVVLGTREIETYRPSDVSAYLRTAQRRLRRHVEERPTTYPWPCDHCSRCDFTSVCRQQWLDDDHLTRVASIRRDQIAKLDTVDVRTLTGLAESPRDLRIRRLAPEMLVTLRDQAALQLHRYRTDEIPVHVLQPEERRGLGLLPAPSDGDLFFDMEGDPLFDPAAGLEFLFGVLCPEPDGGATYRTFWAHNRESERGAFEQFIDFVTERRRVFPDMHVYHYAAYEPSTLARLMGTYATRESEVDVLLRGQVFVDLLQVVRQSLRAGVESYGLKDVEKLFFERKAEVGSGNEAVIEFERWLDDRDDARLDAIAAYNEEDCLATLRLRDWLLERRAQAQDEYGFDIPFLPPPEPYTPAEEETTETTDLRDALLEQAEKGDWRELLARLLEYHKREARPAYWWYFARKKMTDEELVDDGEAIGCLEHDGQEPFDVSTVNRRARSHEWTFQFPAQQHNFDEGDHAEDPREDGTGWTVSSIENATGTVTLRRGDKFIDGPLPTSIVPGSPFPTPKQRAALRRLAASVLDADRRYPHLERLLRREPPLGGASLQRLELDAQRALLDELEDSYLVVQGPPGSGKTWRGARLITHLIRQGRKVGIVAQSHKVIHNLIDAIEKAADEEHLDFRGVKYGEVYETDHVKSGDLGDALDPEVLLVAGTAWLHSREEMDANLDTLFVDEAGQFSLADTLACGTAARRLVLLGDPLQLAQVTQGVHPPGSRASVLEHVIGDRETIAEEFGLFLEQTRRMRPEVCSFISEAFYEGRLRSIDETEEREVSDGAGVRWIAIDHEGNRVESEEEADAIAAEIERLLGQTYTEKAVTRGLTHADFMVVAPYNAQVRLLRERLPGGVEVGTVDKFQGREAPVVLYSMASSSGEAVPRGLDFLLSRNRLNVAVSRARCLAYVVCSPRLLEVDCRTVEHLRLANALCQFVELAGAARASDTGATA
ncbi:MAG TPA: TM0106 family RecB-like putative nuclease [Gaiellaceae bacterium]|nr:TM0106 family RecB-like putative nuclease [Gaiellaceae bacterium]